ncbi:Tripeptidyl-peptidase 2 [Seminavis robusta]|uniref:Tripeptidyl-peptidase 2 n=1 Tax=Seminavis robusta TaxID=568900 RepID=A0A9N8DY73_9STRA|nr:Tripeptidyl-peptidase 2 [Seminavis robusta]|eukprot:Sro468_g149070.1 Tripeptidyl-peptidase 2 (1474) ;mRNA; r:11615-16120
MVMATSPSTTTTAPALPATTPSRWQIPKDETGVIALRENMSTADGRGIRIAVLDTGCDLAARGMQKTSTGQPKYLDFLDCTGDGDIDTRTKKTVDVKEEDDGTVKVTVAGASGKKLTLPRIVLGEDKTPVEVRVGAIPLYQILPKTALNRVRAERKIKFMEIHNTRVAKAQKDLDQLRLQLQQQKGAANKDASDKDKDEGKDQDTPDKEEETAPEKEDSDNVTATSSASNLKKEIKEAETLMDELQDMAKSYSDAGPVMDVVLYQQNRADSGGDAVWHALIDLHADGNLTNATSMTPYAVDHQFGTLQFGSQVTFCVQVYENGDVLNIVADGGSHGTHVAGIAAANYPSEDPVEKLQKDGVAPGAQILACKIGDIRVSTSETGTGLIRALIAAKKYKCHLVNLSYGEPSWQPDRGRVAQVFDDAVHKWGMTVFTSAGNDGPALSTLGSPGALSSPITVGAYVSPQMMADQYSTLMGSSSNSSSADNDKNDPAELPGASYSFSSRGPTPDGVLPDICGPGGAWAPVPTHTLQGIGQKHGTSMSSPNVCGAAAVLLSALKEKGIDVDTFSPSELRRALKNTAIKSTAEEKDSVLDPFAQGAGLVSVTKALDYALAHHGKPGQDLAFAIKIPTSGNARGIFIRDALQLAGPMTKTVSVRPLLQHSIQKTDEEMSYLLSLELDLDLVPSQSWVQCPDRMTLVSTKERGVGQTFAVRMDPRGLPPGAHYATVDAIDSKDPARGPLFQVPITVIIPHAIVSPPPFKFAVDGNVDQTTQVLSADTDKTVEISTCDNGIDIEMRYDLTPGAPSRRFISVPASAEWATIKIRSVTPIAKHEAPHNLILHAVPFARGDLHNKLIQIKKFFPLNEGTERIFHVHVKGGSTLEICMQLSWLSNPSPASLTCDVEFHSLDCRQPTFMASQQLRISSATEFARFGAGAPFRSEKINPKAMLSGVFRTIRPKEYKIAVGSYDDRDIMPPSDAEIKAAATTSEGEEPQQVDGTQIYKMTLEYSFKLADSKEDASIMVTPRIPSLFHQIYDSPIDSQLWVLEDKNGKILGYGSCMHEAAAVSLASKPGGEYKLTFRTGHPKRSVLEQLKDIPLRLTMKMGKELDCPVYSEFDKASTPGVTEDGRDPVKLTALRRGAHCDLYVTRPTAKLPDWVQPGDVMYGKVQLNQKNEGATTFDLFYEVPPKSDVKDGSKQKDDKKTDDKKDDEDQKLEEDFTDSIFKAKVSHLSKLRGKKKSEAYEALADELKQEKADNLPLLEELVSYAKEVKVPDSEKENEKTWRASEVSKAVDAMLSSNGGPIDETAIAQYYGCNNPAPEDDDDDEEQKEEAEKTKKEMGDNRKAWRSALLTKAGAWSDACDATTPPSEDDQTTFDTAVKDMKKWVAAAGDLNGDKEKVRHAVVMARHQRICKSKGVSALASLRKARKDLPEEFFKELTEEIEKVLKGIDGMSYWLQQMKEDMDERYPKVKQIL